MGGSAGLRCPASPESKISKSFDTNNWEFNESGDGDGWDFKEGGVIVQCAVHDQSSDIPLLVLGGVIGVRHSLSKRYPLPPPIVRFPDGFLATFKEARQDRKDILVYVFSSGQFKGFDVWVSNPA